jgi:hypothetical protein
MRIRYRFFVFGGIGDRPQNLAVVNFGKIKSQVVKFETVFKVKDDWRLNSKQKFKILYPNATKTSLNSTKKNISRTSAINLYMLFLCSYDHRMIILNMKI